jgi:hypothetical protein
MPPNIEAYYLSKESKICLKGDDFGFNNYPHLDDNVPHALSYGVYFS